MIEALAAIVFRIKDRRKEDKPVAQDRRHNMNCRQAQKKLRESIERFGAAVERNLRK